MPSKISAVGSIDDKYKVDNIVAVNVLYEDSKQYAQINVNTFAKTVEECNIIGTKGRIRILPPMHCPTKIELYKTVGRELKLCSTKEFPVKSPSEFKHKFIFPNSQEFIHEIEEVTNCLDKGLYESPGYKWYEMLLASKIMDKIRKQIGLKFKQDKFQSKL